jgi:hypothetical protein
MTWMQRRLLELLAVLCLFSGEKWGSVLPVVVGRNGVGDPGGIRVCVDDADGGDVVEGALVQQDVVLERVEADDEVGAQHGAVVQLLVEAGDLGVVLVNHLQLAAAQDLLAVGDAARDPALEQVVPLGQLGGARHGAVLALAGAHEQHDAASPRHLLDDFGGAAQVGGRLLERDDVDALADAVDVARVRRVPQRGGMALVGFRGEEQLEGHVGGRGRVREERVRLVVRADLGAHAGQLLLLLLERVVLRREVVGRGERLLHTWRCRNRIGVLEAYTSRPLMLQVLLECGRCDFGFRRVGGIAAALERPACEGWGCRNQCQWTGACIELRVMIVNVPLRAIRCRTIMVLLLLAMAAVGGCWWFGTLLLSDGTWQPLARQKSKVVADQMGWNFTRLLLPNHNLN